MAAREHVGVERTILCATRFWGGGRYNPSGPGWNKTSWSKGAMPHGTLLQGVKHVVRKQGFTTAAINKALRKLEKIGAVEVGGRAHGKTIRLTEKGGKVGCSTVKLAPWTNDEYPGSRLQGVRRKKRRRKK